MYQWIVHQARTDSGKKITRKLVVTLLNEEYNKLADKLAKDTKAKPQEKAALLKSRDMLEGLVGGNFQEFMSLPAYPLICHTPNGAAKL